MKRVLVLTLLPVLAILIVASSASAASSACPPGTSGQSCLGGQPSSVVPKNYLLLSMGKSGSRCPECKHGLVEWLNPFTALVHKKNLFAKHLQRGWGIAYPGASGERVKEIYRDELRDLREEYALARAYIMPSRFYPSSLLAKPGISRRLAGENLTKLFTSNRKAEMLHWNKKALWDDNNELLLQYADKVQVARAEWNAALSRYRSGKASKRATRRASGLYRNRIASARSAYRSQYAEAEKLFVSGRQSALTQVKEEANSLAAQHALSRKNEIISLDRLQNTIRKQLDRLKARGAKGPAGRGPFFMDKQSYIHPEIKKYQAAKLRFRQLPDPPHQKGCAASPSYCQPL